LKNGGCGWKVAFSGGAGNLATFNPVFGNFLRGCVLIND